MVSVCTALLREEGCESASVDTLHINKRKLTNCLTADINNVESVLRLLSYAAQERNDFRKPC